jgi:hypothetical protein
MNSRQLMFTACAVPLGFAMFSSSASACKNDYICAVVKDENHTSVVLRESQSTESKLLQRLRPYEILVVVKSDCEEESNWTKVASVPRIDGDWDDPLSIRKTTGWVRSSLLAIRNCPQGLSE